MGGTDLDAILRNLGVTTIVAVGVSLNIAIPNLVMDAVNAAYRVVLPRDAVAGLPGRVRRGRHRQQPVPAGHRHHHRRAHRDVAEVTETRGFPELKPVDAPPELERFATAVRRLQDLAVSTNPDGEVPGTTATEAIERACAALEPYQVPDGHAPAGRATKLPGLGHPLMPPWTITELRRGRRRPWRGTSAASTWAATWRCTAGSSRCSTTGTSAWSCRPPAAHQPHRLPARRLPRRHADRQPLISPGRIDRLDGRKAFITATMTDPDGTVLSEANGLMIKLLPHQP